MSSEDTDKQRLKDAFSEWARRLPNPDAPIIGFIGTKLYSAQEAVREVENETPVGMAILDILEHGVKVEGIDKVISRLTRPPGGPR